MKNRQGSILFVVLGMITLLSILTLANGAKIRTLMEEIKRLDSVHREHGSIPKNEREREPG